MIAREYLCHKEMAQRLGLSVKTVQQHIGRLYDRTRVQPRCQTALMGWALKRGLVTVEELR